MAPAIAAIPKLYKATAEDVLQSFSSLAQRAYWSFNPTPTEEVLMNWEAHCRQIGWIWCGEIQSSTTPASRFFCPWLLPIWSIRPVATVPPTGLHPALQPQPSLHVGSYPTFSCPWAFCYRVLEYFPVLHSRLQQIPWVPCDTARLSLVQSHLCPPLSASSHHNASLYLWVLGSSVI